MKKPTRILFLTLLLLCFTAATLALAGPQRFITANTAANDENTLILHDGDVVQAYLAACQSDKYEVTNARYAQCVAAGEGKVQRGGGIGTSWSGTRVANRGWSSANKMGSAVQVMSAGESRSTVQIRSQAN